MPEGPPSNRPTPRTAASMEAELRRRIRAELTQARSDAESGQVDDATLAQVIAGAIAAALGWHLESPEHTRNATVSSRTWRSAGGPRGGRPPDSAEENRPPRDFGARPPRQFGPRGPRDFGDRPPRDFGDRPPRDYGDRPPRDYGDRPPRDYGDRPPRDFGDRPPRDYGDRPPRDFGDRPPRDYGDRPQRDFGKRPPNRGGGGFRSKSSRGPRRPPPRGR
jgi:hypothetical protein